MTKRKIGFIGQGWIGKNYANDFEKRGFVVVRYALEKPYKKNKDKIKDCDIVFIAVPTPTTPTGFCYKNIAKVLPLIGEGKTAVIKSTILPYVIDILQQKFPSICILHSPEFLTEATAEFDSANPQRNIIGVSSLFVDAKERAQEVMDILPYAPYKLICSAEESAFIKYGGNNWFYFKVVFINMLYDLVRKYPDCRWEVIRDAMSADSRIGRTHLDPIHKSGRGAGGHCFIKDMEAFRLLYKDKAGDLLGNEVFDWLVTRNRKYLKDTNKDLDIAKSVFGGEEL